MEIQQPHANVVRNNTFLQENNILREKIENLKIVIKHCNQHLHTEEVKNAGAETVIKLLQETQFELQATLKQKKALEAAVRNLQSRLSVHKLPNDISLGENDVYIAGLSPQMLENLARENVRLKNLLHQCASSDEIKELNRTQDVIDQLHKEISNLSLENDVLQAEIKRERNLEKCDESEKYNGSEKLENDPYLNDFQVFLRNFTGQCLDLDEKINKVKNESQNKRQPDKMTDEMETMQAAKEVNQHELKQLQKKVDEVNSMNMRWQDYNKQRENHIKDLNSHISELQTNHSIGGQTDIAETLNIATGQLAKCQHERDQVFEELTDLRLMIENLQHLLEEKDAKVKEVQEQLKNVSTGVISGDKETVAVLMAQIQICAEDFENERKDRARAQAELTEMRSQLERAKKEANRYKMMYQTRYQQVQYHPGGHSIPAQESQLSSRGHRDRREDIVSDVPGSLNMKEYEIVEYDKNNFKSLPVSSNKRSKEVLCCPKCGRNFLEGDKLLSHIETCVD